MASQRLRRTVTTYPVASFFVLAYAFSWVAWLPVVLGVGEQFRTLSIVVGSFGPAIAGAVVTWLDGASVGVWARRIVRWRVAPRWYLAALVLPLFVVGVASVGIGLLGYGVDLSVLRGRGPAVLASFLTVALVGGGNEEPGWRGFALPRLQNRYAPVSATLLLGVVWACWHLPLLPVDTSIHGVAWLLEQGPTVALRVLNIVGFAFLLTWMYNRTESVLLALLTHAGINTANSTLVPLPLAALGGDAYDAVLLTVTVAVWLVAIMLVVHTRGRLGYDEAGPSAPR
jgi:membrane protease YdiL (CAAX protease family)